MDNVATLRRSGDHTDPHQGPVSLEKRAMTRLRALFDECLVLLALERGRAGTGSGARDARDWLGQCRRVADVMDGRDIYVRDTMKKLDEMLDGPAPRASVGFDGFLKHVQRAREERFCQMVGVLEADGTLPLAG